MPNSRKKGSRTLLVDQVEGFKGLQCNVHMLACKRGLDLIAEKYEKYHIWSPSTSYQRTSTKGKNDCKICRSHRANSPESCFGGFASYNITSWQGSGDAISFTKSSIPIYAAKAVSSTRSASLRVSETKRKLQIHTCTAERFGHTCTNRGPGNSLLYYGFVAASNSGQALRSRGSRVHVCIKLFSYHSSALCSHAAECHI